MIQRDTVKRLLKDVKDIIKNPLTDNGIYYVHDEEDMLKGYALIIGPQDTPYFGGYYFFNIKYPQDYPFSLPTVKYCTNANNVRFHPNLYSDGKVCISILNTWKGEQWSSCQNISSILLSLFTLFKKNPLLLEPGVKKTNVDVNTYNKIIEYANIDIAFCDILNKKTGVYLPFFNLFETIMRENFIKNIEKIDEFVNNQNKNIEELRLQYYYNRMNIIIDYKSVINKLHHLKTIYN